MFRNKTWILSLFLLFTNDSYSQNCNDSIPLEPCTFEFNRCYLLEQLEEHKDSLHLDVEEFFFVTDCWEEGKNDFSIDYLAPEAFLKLKQLESFSSPTFSPIPQQIGQLQNLKKVQQEHLLFIPSIFYRTPPASLWKLPDLESLKLFSDTIPDGLTDLKKLESLVLYASQLAPLPSTTNWAKLKVLKKLYFLVDQFPNESLFCWNSLALNSFVFLVNNDSKNIPAYFKSLENSAPTIEALHLSFDINERSKKAATALKIMLVYPQLSTLILRYCKLSNFSFKGKQLPLLQRLDLNNNELQKLPCSIGKLQNLKILSIQKNPLKRLPQSLKRLKNLEKIYVSDDVNEVVLQQLTKWFGPDKIIKGDKSYFQQMIRVPFR